MLKFVATVNIPGYMPTEEESPKFETAREAWSYLADERERAEDETEGEDYSETHATLVALAMSVPGNPDQPFSDSTPGVMDDLTGSVYGDTPGYEGEHDLGLAYSVDMVED